MTGTHGRVETADRGQRVYDWWSRHRFARRLLYAVAFSGRERTFRQRGVDALSLASGESVLELGCGPGSNFQRLRDAVGESGRVVGVDYSAGMVRQARTRAAEWQNVHAVRGDGTALPVADDTFDAAYAAMSLTAMPDVTAALREAAATLRPGGRIAVLDAGRFQRFPLTLLNPLTDRLFTLTTNWNPEQDVPSALDSAFHESAVTRYNGGTILVGTARTAADSLPD